jgi:hypothetical protein
MAAAARPFSLSMQMKAGSPPVQVQVVVACVTQQVRALALAGFRKPTPIRHTLARGSLTKGRHRKRKWPPAGPTRQAPEAVVGPSQAAAAARRPQAAAAC